MNNESFGSALAIAERMRDVSDSGTGADCLADTRHCYYIQYGEPCDCMPLTADEITAERTAAAAASSDCRVCGASVPHGDDCVRCESSV